MEELAKKIAKELKDTGIIREIDFEETESIILDEFQEFMTKDVDE